MYKTINLYNHTCCVCGKEFECTSGYVYKKYRKRQYLYFCSYACMRKDENQCGNMNLETQSK